MSTKLKLQTRLLQQPGFIAAFDALGADPIPVKDRYALARSRQDIMSNAETFRSQHLALVQKHGEPEVALLKRRIAQLEATAGKDDPQAKRLAARVAALEANKVVSFSVDESNEVTMALFNEELKALQSVEFEIFLDHKIILPADSKLTGAEIGLLLDLVDVAAEPNQK